MADNKNQAQLFEDYGANVLAGVGGGELIALGFEPGPRIGRTLEKLLEAVIEGELPNDRETLLEKAKELKKRMQ